MDSGIRTKKIFRRILMVIMNASMTYVINN